MRAAHAVSGAFAGARTNSRMIRRPHDAPTDSIVSPSEVTWTVLASVTTRTSAPSFGAKSFASTSGVRESRSPPTTSSGIDAGSGALVGETTGAVCVGTGQSRHAR